MATKRASKTIAPVAAFTTKRVVADRRSSNVIPQAMHFDEATRSIKVFCDDGFTRECKVDRLADINAGRKIYQDIQMMIKEGTRMRFIAAGGFDPNKWFYTIEAYKEPTNGLPF